MTLKTTKKEEKGAIEPKTLEKNDFLDNITFLMKIREVCHGYLYHGKVLFENLSKLNQVIVLDYGKEQES